MAAEPALLYKVKMIKKKKMKLHGNKYMQLRCAYTYLATLN